MRRGWYIGLAFWLLGFMVPTTVQATPLLKCHFEVNAERSEQTFTPTMDPYTVGSVNLANRFRFKAIVLGNDTRVTSIHLYVSYQTERQPMLLQHAKFVAPQALEQPTPDALTGRVAVYSPFLGKELQYGCALHEVSP
jgi:hypothetical protein